MAYRTGTGVVSAGKERAIHLFASPPDSQEFLYAGELEASYKAVAPKSENHGMEVKPRGSFTLTSRHSPEMVDGRAVGMVRVADGFASD